MYRMYNFVAELCSFVIQSCTEDFFVHYSCIAPVERQQIDRLLYERLPKLFVPEEGQSGSSEVAPLQIRQLERGDLSDSFYSEMDGVFSDLSAQSDFFAVTRLTQVLDESLASLLLLEIEKYQEDDFSVVLNTNRESTGIGLLPRCSCIWERKHRLSHTYNRMDNFLYHFLLLEHSILREVIDMHFFLKKEFFPGFQEKRSLKIAATPLRIERKFSTEVYTKDRVQYFRVFYEAEDFTEDNELIWEKIRLAAQQESDIILFPEMLGNGEMVSFIRAKLKALTKEEREKIPSLIILPSYWEKNRNTVTVLDRHGNVICKQRKQNPFRVEYQKSGYLEGITPSMVVNILHFEGIGRIAILICKDFLTTKYVEQLMRCFKLTLILVPSFSSGSYDFRQTFDLCAHDDCNVVWINSCAAMERGKEGNFENIGYVRKRISRIDDEAQKLCPMPICKQAVERICSHDCIYFETIRGV